MELIKVDTQHYINPSSIKSVTFAYEVAKHYVAEGTNESFVIWEEIPEDQREKYTETRLVCKIFVDTPEEYLECRGADAEMVRVQCGELVPSSVKLAELESTYTNSLDS